MVTEQEMQGVGSAERSIQYLWMVLAISVIYIPFPVQVSAPPITLQTIIWMYSTDTLDTCYYNFSCLRPAGGLLPFNNVLSNTGYVAAGGGALAHRPRPRLPAGRPREGQEGEGGQARPGGVSRPPTRRLRVREALKTKKLFSYGILP